MAWIDRLLCTFRPERFDNALDDELGFHIAQRTDEFIAQGMSRAEARRLAERMFGNRTALRESTRDRNVLVWLESTLQDVRYALRGVRRRPGFAAAAVLSLALGIGANTALFSLLDALLLKTAPVADPRALVRVVDGDIESVPGLWFDTLRTGAHSFSGVTAVQRSFGELDITEHGEPRSVFLQPAASGYFDVLGVTAWQGRVFHADDARSPEGAVAVISESYWRTHYGASPSALGAHFQYLTRDYTVVGIAPPGFRGMLLDFPADIWVPLEQAGSVDPKYWNRGRALVVLGRLRPGVTSAQATTEIGSLLRRKLTLVPGGTGYSALRVKFWQPLTVVECVAGLVLLIACANLANLMLAGAAARQSEIAIRQSIGAGRMRLVRQWLTESLMIAAMGAASGLLVAAWMSRALLAFLPPSAAPALGNLQFRLDLRVLAFNAALAVLTCLLFGLAPALRATRMAPNRGFRTASHLWSNRALVVCQVALCTVLLMGAGLFLRSLGNLRQADGAVTDRLVVATTRSIRGASRQETAHAEQELRVRAAGIPGVRIAASSDIGVLSGFGVEFAVGDHEKSAARLLVSPGFFAAMGIPRLAGRDIAPADDTANARVAVVNETFVREMLPPGNPIGRRFRSTDETPAVDVEVVGVVQDVRMINLREKSQPTFYAPYRDRSRGTVTMALRVSGDPAPVMSALERMTREIDPRWGLRDVAPFREIEDRSLVVERLVAQTSAAFGALAVLVASIGLYGVLALGVGRRTKEIGLRIALGASRSGVHWMVMREALTLLALGIAVGVPCAVTAARFVATMLYGLAPGDSTNLAVTLSAMTVVAVAAALIPAVRAARVDPMVALRCD